VARANEVLVVAVDGSPADVKTEPSELYDQSPELNPVDVPRVAKVTTKSSSPAMLNASVNDFPLAVELTGASAFPAISPFKALVVEPPNADHSLPVDAVTQELDPSVPLAYSVPVPELAGITVAVFGAATRLLKFQ